MNNREKETFAHGIAILRTIMHVSNNILFSSLCLIITKADVKFQANVISSYREKVERIDKYEEFVI